jgi:hypothetical protein
MSEAPHFFKAVFSFEEALLLKLKKKKKWGRQKKA